MAFKRKYGIMDTLGASETGANSSSSGNSNTGMDTMDWVGIGMQVAGALANQKEEDQARALEQTRYNQGLQIGNRKRMDTLQQKAVENQQTARTQNQKGLDYMTNLVTSNEAQARRSVPSFRQTMLYGGL
jgi:hypothetical protein